MKRRLGGNWGNMKRREGSHKSMNFITRVAFRSREAVSRAGKKRSRDGLYCYEHTHTTAVRGRLSAS